MSQREQSRQIIAVMQDKYGQRVCLVNDHSGRFWLKQEDFFAEEQDNSSLSLKSNAKSETIPTLKEKMGKEELVKKEAKTFQDCFKLWRDDLYESPLGPIDLEDVSQYPLFEVPTGYEGGVKLEQYIKIKHEKKEQQHSKKQQPQEAQQSFFSLPSRIYYPNSISSMSYNFSNPFNISNPSNPFSPSDQSNHSDCSDRSDHSDSSQSDNNVSKEIEQIGYAYSKKGINYYVVFYQDFTSAVFSTSEMLERFSNEFLKFLEDAYLKKKSI